MCTCRVTPVYTQAGARSMKGGRDVVRRTPPTTTTATATAASSVLFAGLILVMAPSLVLSADISHAQHHHPVDMDQWSVRAPGDVRCYCNLPACITTGYMCKSAGRGCFSDLVDHVDVFRARHGCLDLIGSDRQRQCKNQPRPDPEGLEDDVPAWERNSNSNAPETSLLLCCTEDMCNHIDSPDARVRQSGGQNDSEGGAVLVEAAVGPAPGAGGLAAGVAGAMLGAGAGAAGAGAAGTGVGAVSQSAEVWFKAATIAVPICGALILFLLIALAVRLLRADTQHHRMAAHKLRMKPSAFPALSDKKVPLLLQHNLVHGAEKHVTIARLGNLGNATPANLIDLPAPPCNLFAANGLPRENHSVHSKCKQVLASFMPWSNNSSLSAATAADV